MPEAADDETAPAGMLDKTAGEKTAEGFAHRRTADLELRRHLFLTQPITRPERSAPQALAQGTINGFAKRQLGVDRWQGRGAFVGQARGSGIF